MEEFSVPLRPNQILSFFSFFYICTKHFIQSYSVDIVSTISRYIASTRRRTTSIIEICIGCIFITENLFQGALPIRVWKDDVVHTESLFPYLRILYYR